MHINKINVISTSFSISYLLLPMCSTPITIAIDKVIIDSKRNIFVIAVLAYSVPITSRTNADPKSAVAITNRITTIESKRNMLFI
jgi:hypothetical protein